MNKTVKKGLSTLLALSLTAGGAIAVTKLELARSEREKAKKYYDSELERSLYFSLCDNNFDSKTFYVHKNEDNKTIISEKESINGYENKGIYNSTSSFEKVLFTMREHNGKIEYEAVSYEDIEKQEYEDLMYYIIDENAPEGIKKEGFVPDCSITKITFLKKAK